MDNENNKKEYSTGYTSFGFNNMPDFDSLERKSQPQSIPVKKQNVQSNVKQQNTINPVAPKEPTVQKQVKKKSKAFGFICAVMIIAIIASCALTGFNYINFRNSNLSDSSVGTLDNIYSEMTPKFDSAKYPSGIQKKFTKLYAANKEFAGWIYVPGTNINTPVVQNKSDDYYLRNNFFHSHTYYGQAYLASTCKKESLSKNTVIYGHNMPAGTHFYDANRYEDIEWYKKHPIIRYSTLKDDYTFLIYTAFYATVNPEDDNNYAFNYISANMNDSNFKGYIRQVDERALYKTDVDINSSDKVITLSTCNHTYDHMCGKKVNSRLVVVGRLLRSNESEDVDTSKAKLNPNYRKPQVYYKAHGKSNPYQNSEKWYPAP